MAIKTSTFSGWNLSGKDAEAFRAQIKNSKPNKQAQETLSRGKRLIKEYDEQGSVTLHAKTEKQTISPLIMKAAEQDIKDFEVESREAFQLRLKMERRLSEL